MHEENNGRRKKKSRQKASRKVKKGVWYLERRRRPSRCLATSSHCSAEWDSRRRNSSYVSAQCHFCSAEPCMSTALQIQREPCMSVTDSVCETSVNRVRVCESIKPSPPPTCSFSAGWRHPSNANRRYFDPGSGPD